MFIYNTVLQGLTRATLQYKNNDVFLFTFPLKLSSAIEDATWDL